ncbi:MAG: ABC transporter permease, partial [Acidobacteriia bacterium]|nr:ABC transporter permease [Terriglobia bacterium]
MFRDIRYAFRVLAKNPAFSLIAILTLALGIGANAAIFSVVYGVLLRPLPYKDGDRLVILHQKSSRGPANVPFSVHEITDYREMSHTLESVVEHHSMNFLLLANDSAERVNTAVVSANFFDVLGIKPILGRTFVASDEDHGADAVLVLSYEYWRSRHGSDPNIVGKIFQMNNRPHTVIGVLPPIPQYPVENDVYMPTSQCPTRSSPQFIANRKARLMTAFARVRPGVSMEQVQADLSTVAGQMVKANPDAYPASYGYAMNIAALREDLAKRGRTTFLVLLGAAGLVLLIACANVANLLLARFLKLGRELAVRAALGAGKGRLVRQVLAESMLLAISGAGVGLLIAPSALSLLSKFAQKFTTRAGEIRMDTPVLLFTLGIALLTGLLFGLAPAFSITKNAGEALKHSGSRSMTSLGGNRLRGALVVAQVAVSFMLLIGAGLMIRSFERLMQVNPGFAADHLLTMRLSPNFTKITQASQLTTLAKSVLQRVGSMGGVQSAALASNFPFSPTGIVSGPGSVNFVIEGRPLSAGELAPLVDTTVVSSDYFQTVRQPIVAGRSFTDHDDTSAPPVVVINQTMKNHRWPTEDPVGRRISFDQGQHWARIVGIAADVREYGLEHAVKDEVYIPLFQNGFAAQMVIRTQVDPESMGTAVRALLHDIDSQLAVDRIKSIEHWEREAVASPRVTTMLLGLFAGLALLISAAGIAAVIALTVAQRTNELGIRLALGASRESIVAMVLRQGLVMVAVGIVVGIAGAIGLTRLLQSLLFETSPTDPFT